MRELWKDKTINVNQNTMNEYIVIDVVGASKFSKAMNEMEKKGFVPFFPHVIYIKDDEVHFTIAMSKYTSIN